MFSSSRYHIGFLGYDADNKKGYGIWSSGLNDGQRFDMAYETVFGLSLIKTNISFKEPEVRKFCYHYQFRLSPIDRITINTAALGNAARLIQGGWNAYELLRPGHQHTLYQHWYGSHYYDDPDDDNYGGAKY